METSAFIIVKLCNYAKTKANLHRFKVNYKIINWMPLEGK